MVSAVVLLVVGAVVAACCYGASRRAVLRGTEGKPFPAGADRAIRLCFLTALLWPLLWVLPAWAVAGLWAAYLPGYLDGSEKTGGRPSAFVQGWPVWRWFKRRTHLRLQVTEPLDPQGAFVFGLHPHGVLPFGGIINFATSVNGGGLEGQRTPGSPLFGVQVRLLAASFAFYLPLWRDLLLAGGVCDAARYCAEAVLRSGRSLALVPGGASEALLAGVGRSTLVLRRRRGFVRLAIRAGASLVPCYTFGENDCFATVSTERHPVARRLMAAFQSVFGISLPLVLNVVPRACRCTTVVGARIPVRQEDCPSEETVDEYLALYCEALMALFQQHKATLAPGAEGLRIT